MTSCDFLIFIFGLCFVLLPCEGKIIPPSGRTEFLPGSDAKIRWSFDNVLTDDTIRDWLLVNNEGGANTLLARIIGVGSTPVKLLPGFAVEGKATLVIKNFNESRNGQYRFTLSGETSDFVVSVIKKPDAVLNCSSPVTLNKGERITCLCRGENGNPAPDVTWRKDSKQIGEVKKKNNTLTIDGDDWRNRGTYTCKAESYPDPRFIDEKSIEVKINFKPTNTKIELVPNPVKVGGEVKITCSSDGFPEPNYIITLDDTRLITTAKTATLRNVQLHYTGTYKCLANNSLGSDSDSKYLNVKEQGPTTTTSANLSRNTASTEADIKDKTCSNDSSCSRITEWHIVVTLVAGIAIGIILSYIVSFSRRKLRSRKPQPNPEPPTSQVDTTYQELDLKKMNKEDNYQSLRENAEKNEDDSTYTELSKTRDVESNYQSLK